MKTVEVRRFDGEDKIFINDQLFDWGIDDEAIQQINNIGNPEELNKVHENIMSYFLDCIEPFLEKKVTIKELYQAIECGKLE